MGDLPLDAESIELMLGIDPATIDVIADGGSKPNNAMVAWANELQVGAWFTLDHNSRVNRVQFAWRSERKHLNLFASVDGHTYLIQAGRLAAYLQAGLLLPQEEETLTVRATRDALAKLEANPTEPTLLLTEPGGTLAQERAQALYAGRVISISGTKRAGSRSTSGLSLCETF